MRATKKLDYDAQVQFAKHPKKGPLLKKNDLKLSIVSQRAASEVLCA